MDEPKGFYPWAEDGDYKRADDEDNFETTPFPLEPVTFSPIRRHSEDHSPSRDLREWYSTASLPSTLSHFREIDHFRKTASALKNNTLFEICASDFRVPRAPKTLFEMFTFYIRILL